MPEWKIEIKKIANDFCISQVKLNRVLKQVEEECAQKEMPNFYKGDRNEYLYDTAQREMMKLIYA